MLEKHKDVARIDQESKRTHGWYVRVKFMGKTHTKFFFDGKYGVVVIPAYWRHWLGVTKPRSVWVRSAATGMLLQ